MYDYAEDQWSNPLSPPPEDDYSESPPSSKPIARPEYVEQVVYDTENLSFFVFNGRAQEGGGYGKVRNEMEFFSLNLERCTF